MSEGSRLRVPRSTATVLDLQTLLESEIRHDTTNDELRYGDGATVGGIPLAKKSDATLLATRVGDLGVNPLDRAFGAVGDGVTDDTDALDAANAYAIANNRPLIIPGGYTFYYNGDGLTGAHICVLGHGISQSIIVLGDGKYFIDDADLWGSLRVEGIRFVGGTGIIRSRYTSAMVQLEYIIRGNYFLDYTGCAISNNSSDSPHWLIEDNIFQSANDNASIGVALKGLTDSNLLRHNSFRKNKVHLKMGDGGNNAYVAFNDFIQYDGGSARHDIWIVPDADGTNAGGGLIVSNNKFGNENSDNSDFMVSYADEGSGTYFGDRLPDMGTNSTGYIRGHSFTNNAIYSDTGTPYQPFVKSMTKRVFGCQYGPLTIGGTPPTYVIEFSQAPDALAQGDAHWNVVGPILNDGADTLAGFAPASSYNSVKVFDPAGSSTWKTKQPIVVEKVDDGGVGAALWLYHNSASPAASDIPGLFVVRGNDSAGNAMNYGDIRLYIGDPTDGSEDSEWHLSTIVAGTYAARFVVKDGIFYDGGSDPGAGKYNGLAFHVAGTQVVGAQGSAVADALTGGSATAADCATQLNLILARLRAHGLIAT